MTEKEAIYILRNAAWLGSDADRQKVEEAVEVVAKAIEARDMILYMNLPEVSVEEAIEILKRKRRLELILSDKDTNVPSDVPDTNVGDIISRSDLLKQIYIDAGEGRGYYGDTWKFIDTIKKMPPAQPEKMQLSGESTTKDSTFDCISRQAAIDARCGR